MFVNNIFEALRLHVENSGKTLFEFPEGNIIFSMIESHLKNRIDIYFIEFKKEFQRKGLFKSLMNEIITNYPSIEEVWIIETCALFSVILQTSTFGGRYFINKGTGEMCWVRSSASPIKNRYDHENSEKISRLLFPAKQMLINDNYEGFILSTNIPEIWRCL